jgi:hypothetical protein
MKRSLLALVLVLVLLVPASLALAGLPKPTDPEVVVPTTLGGIKLAMAEAKAKAAWGTSRAKCESVGGANTRCYYGVGQTPSGYGYFELRDHKVSAAVVYSGSDAGGEPVPTAAKSIMEMKTKGGIGIGSKLSAVKAAYPKGELAGSTSEERFSWGVKGKGKSAFYFTFEGDSKRVITMAVNDGLPA